MKSLLLSENIVDVSNMFKYKPRGFLIPQGIVPTYTGRKILLGSGVCVCVCTCTCVCVLRPTRYLIIRKMILVGRHCYGVLEGIRDYQGLVADDGPRACGTLRVVLCDD